MGDGRARAPNSPWIKREYNHAHTDMGVHARDRKTNTHLQTNTRVNMLSGFAHAHQGGQETDFVRRPQ